MNPTSLSDALSDRVADTRPRASFVVFTGASGPPPAVSRLGETVEVRTLHATSRADPGELPGILILSSEIDMSEGLIKVPGHVVIVAQDEAGREAAEAEGRLFLSLEDLATEEGILRAVRSAAHHSWSLLGQARYRFELARTHDQLQDLNKIGMALMSERDPEALLGLILTQARSVTTSDAGSLYLVEGAAFLYLGLSHEALENWSGAREAYSRYIEVGRLDPLKDELRGRLAMIVREELRAQARETLAQEAQISAQPPAPQSIAVFPMRYVSGPPELQPLQVAMADMMITDLSQAQVLTVLERTQIQTLLDEMALTESGLTEPATGARAGRVLRAEHVVQGALTALGNEGIRLDADVLQSAQGTTVGEVLAEDELEAIFVTSPQERYHLLC